LDDFCPINAEAVLRAGKVDLEKGKMSLTMKMTDIDVYLPINYSSAETLLPKDLEASYPLLAF
jgi:hypothetical protein